MATGLKKQYGLLMAICMVVGTVVGSGVFFKAKAILNTTNGDMPLGIIAWVIGGAVMIFCVLAFCVMAQRYEKVNGVVDYAEATIGGKYAYMMGWFTTTIYTPAMTSVLAWLTASYFLKFIRSFKSDFILTSKLLDQDVATDVSAETFLLAGFILILVFAVNTLSSKLAGKLQISATFIKLIPLLLMAVGGIIYGLTHDLAGDALTENATSILAANFSTSSGDTKLLFGAVVATAFAYEGWILATSINSEIKNSKRNLPIALVAGGIIIVAIYLFYYIGVAGGADVDTLRTIGATEAFMNVFKKAGVILNLFVAISCLGTLNGLLIGCIRGMYSLSVRNMGPKVKLMKQVDSASGMPANSCIVGLVIVAAWLVYFYGANLVTAYNSPGAENNIGTWFGKFSFDSSELPIITIYALYIPMFIMFMIKEKGINPLKRFVLPALGIIGSGFMVFAAIYSHGYLPYITAKADGEFACPVLFYLIVFAVIMGIGLIFMKPKKAKQD